MNAPEPRPHYRAMRHPGEQERQEKRHFQSLLAVVALGLLGWALAAKFTRVAHDGEQVSMRTTIGQVESAIAADLARRRVNGQMDGLAAMRGGNPFALFDFAPANYAGVVRYREERPGPGNWYFDPRLQDLVYRVRDRRGFSTEGPYADELRLYLELRYADADGDGRYSPVRDSLNGVELRPRYAYQWH